MDEFVTLDSHSASDVFPNFNLDLLFLENCDGYD